MPEDGELIPERSSVDATSACRRRQGPAAACGSLGPADDAPLFTGAKARDLLQRMGHDSPVAALIYQHASGEADKAIASAVSAELAGRDQQKRELDELVRASWRHRAPRAGARPRGQARWEVG